MPVQYPTRAGVGRRQKLMRAGVVLRPEQESTGAARSTRWTT